MNAADLNAMNQAFWSGQTEVLQRRLADPLVNSAVLREVRSELLRLPVVYRRSIEEIAEAVDTLAGGVLLRQVDATREDMKAASERGASDALRCLASKGGSAKKGDELKKFIDKTVAQDPAISVVALTLKLKAGASTKGFEWLDQVDDEAISLATGKTIKPSGLKDRLTRAKRDLKRASR